MAGGFGVKRKFKSKAEGAGHSEDSRLQVWAHDPSRPGRKALEEGSRDRGSEKNSKGQLRGAQNVTLVECR